MHDELTKTDLEKMRAELDERRLKRMPELIEEVKRTRAFGDLSENFEYKAAKQAQNRNRSRIRYLERMIASAQLIEDRSAPDEVGLYDEVEILLEATGMTQTVRVVTTVRTDPGLEDYIWGDKVNETFSYTARIQRLEKGSDDGSAALLQY